MPHKLTSTFTSFTFNQTSQLLRPDLLGDFDLRGIQPGGTIGAGCYRTNGGVQGAPITGQAREIDPDPLAYQVEIEQTQPVKVQYKGIALFDARNEITSIAGFRKYIAGVGDDPRIVESLGLLDQDETTWVVTKP